MDRRHRSTVALLSEVAELLEERPSWHRRAACRGLGPDTFFPPVSTRVADAAVQRARQVCRSCPVQDACALQGEREPHGIWAGRLRVPSSIRPGRRRSTAILDGVAGL